MRIDSAKIKGKTVAFRVLNEHVIVKMLPNMFQEGKSTAIFQSHLRATNLFAIRGTFLRYIRLSGAPFRQPIRAATRPKTRRTLVELDCFDLMIKALNRVILERSSLISVQCF